jgi:hypothetical protein
MDGANRQKQVSPAIQAVGTKRSTAICFGDRASMADGSL